MAIKLSEVAEGSILLLNENGSPVEFYVAKHDYEAGLNGSGRTLVVRKDCYDARVWNSAGTNNYANGSISTWLNGDYLALFGDELKELIGKTTIYYTPGNGNTTVTTGKFAAFLLSLTELGKSETYARVEGSTLPIAEVLQIAYYNGTAVKQWTRTPPTSNTNNVWALSASGTTTTSAASSTTYARPAFTLPSTIEVAETEGGELYA